MYTVHSNILVTIEFDFKNGDKLELKEHYIGIIRFDDFQIKGCRGKEFSFGTIFGAKALNGFPGPRTRMKGTKHWDPSTWTRTLGFGMFESQVLGPTVPGPK